uniref:Reverse transcriptase domain-containing protein n=1 Tax=Tanacetum cinerariifolium TaxID=118510 RepID=A0A6L2LNJ2_TANCI|nr:reverse transcriptase domain-containing protein [Tanacetum cinerariifolium]
MRQRQWIELLSDFDCEIKYHSGKENVVVDALSRKEGLKPRRVRTMSMTIQSGLKAKILEAHDEDSKDLKSPTEWLRDIHVPLEEIEIDENLCFVEEPIKIMEVIVNGDSVSSASAEAPIPPKTAEQKLSRKNKLKAKNMEHIDTDDLEEIDLKWQVAMLTMRVKRFIKKTRRKLDLNGKEIVGFDRTKFECYNYHRRGHFARECRHQKIRGIEIEMLQQGMHQLTHLLQMPCRESDGDDNQVNDRFKKSERYHAVPPSYTGNYTPPRADLSFAGLDNSVFKSKAFQPKSAAKTNNFNEKINTAKVNIITTVGPKAVVSAAEGN